MARSSISRPAVVEKEFYLSKRPIPSSLYIILSSVLIVGIFHTAIDTGVTNDDAYIFYRYAENFAKTGEMVFNIGKPSYGYSSFLWTYLLAWSVTVTGLSPIFFAKMFSVLFLLTGTFFIFKTLLITTESEPLAALGAFVYSHDPFMLSNSYEGMESGFLLCLYSSLLLFTARSGLKKPVRLAVLVALSFYVRPEMILLVPAFIITDLLELKVMKEKILSWKHKNLLFFIITFLLLVAPYCIYMLVKTGHPIPQTYIGKVLTHNPRFFEKSFFEQNLEAWKTNSLLLKNLFTRPLNMFLSGMLTLFLPLFVIPILTGIKKKKLFWITPFYFYSLFLFISHSLRFPTANWRYYITLYPTALIGLFTVLFGLHEFGLLQNLKTLHKSRRFLVIAVIALASLVALTPNTFNSHRISHGFDKAQLIGDWLNKYLPAESVLAFDMIGAIGYSTNVEIFDICGLIEPEMWPCMIERGNAQTTISVFKARGVTHIATLEYHIAARPYINALKNNLKLIANLHLSPDKADVFKVYEIQYKPSEKRAPVFTGEILSTN